MLPEGFLVKQNAVTDVEIQSKKRLLEYIAELLVETNPDLTVSGVFEKLIERERLGSTGLGKGIALPHARIEGLSQARAVFVRLAKGIDFDAPDSVPVDLVVALLVPAEADETHLKILAGLAGFFNQDSNCQKLRNIEDVELLVDLLCRGIENKSTD